MKDKLFELLLKRYFEAQCKVIYNSPGEAAPKLDELNKEIEKMRSDYFGNIPDQIEKHSKRD